MSDSLQLYGLYSLSGSVCPWDSPDKNTEVGCHALLQRIFQGPRIKPSSLISPALAGGFLTTSATWEAPTIQGGRINQEFGIKIYIPTTYKIDNHQGLHSTGNYSQYLLITCNGKESKYIYIYTYI